MNDRFKWWTWLLVAVAVLALLAFRYRRFHGGALPAADPADAEPSAELQPRLEPDEPSSDATLARAVLSGRVLDTAAKPIVGASVCVFASSDRLVSAETRAPRCTTSAADGRYRFEGLLVARYDVSASAPRYQPARWKNAATGTNTLELKAGEVRDGIDLVLSSGGVEVRGRINDIAGGPVAGALVSIEKDAVAESDAKGEWTAWATPGPIRVSAVAAGYTEGSADGIAPGQFIEISLTPESVLEGRVVEAGTNTPVAGARVSAEQATALTDAEGQFRIPGLEPGRYKPEARSAHRWGIASESVLLGVGETSSEVIIEVHPAATVSGRIVLGDAAAPACAEGSVDLIEVATGDHRGAKPDEEGRVRIEGVLTGRYDVEITCPDTALEDQYEPVTVGTEDVTGLIWKVKRGFTVRGKVVDATGQPVARVQVSAQTAAAEAQPRARLGWKDAETEKNGAFRLTGLTAATYRLNVSHDRGSNALKEPLELKVDRNIDGVRIVLPANGSIEGTVVDGTGAAASKMRVEARGDRYDLWNETMVLDNGTFVLKDVAPGEYRVKAANHGWDVARAPGTKDDDVQGVSATVRARTVSRVKLVVEPHRSEIRGRVVDDGGQPVTDAFIDAARESDSASKSSGDAERSTRWEWNRGTPALTDLDGKFTVSKLSPGTYTVRAYRKGGGEAVSEHVPVGSTITMAIRKSGSISGTVTGARGKAPQRFTVVVADKKKGFFREETFFRTNGSFKMRDLPAGDFEVSAEAAEGRALAQIALEQGEKRDGVALTLEEGASLHGRVVAFDSGQPVAGIMVFVQATKGGSGSAGMMDEGNRKNITDTDGRFEIEHCPAGRVTVTAFPRDFTVSAYSVAYVPMTLEAGKANEAPPIRLPRRRTKGLGLGGDLGFATREMDPTADPEQTQFMVSVVRPNGPAAKAGLLVGDEIVSVEGHDVLGGNAYLYETLANAPEGDTVTFGLRRGASIAIKAEKPL